MSDTSAALPASGDHAVLSRRYAGVLLALAEEQKVVDDIVAEMRSLRRLWAECPEWRAVALDPRLGERAFAAAAAEVIKISGMSKLSANFLSSVAQNRRLALLPSIIEGFLEEVAVRRGEYRADVRVAKPLSPGQRDALTASLSAMTGGKIQLAVLEDASIIGGMTVKIGSQFIDASVKTKLDRLERQLKAGLAA